jgi:hypothetical protein
MASLIDLKRTCLLVKLSIGIEFQNTFTVEKSGPINDKLSIENSRLKDQLLDKAIIEKSPATKLIITI